MLQLAHGLVAGSVGYMLAYAGILWWHSAPGSPRATLTLVALFALGVFEASYLYYWFARRARMRNLWREAARFLKLEQYESARARLLELADFIEYRLSPQPVLFALGAATEGLGEEREALVLYRRCGDFAPALRAIGMLQLQRGLNDNAADAFRKVAARHPEELASTVLLALALHRGGHLTAAARVLQRALERRPRSEMLKVNLARVERGEEPAFELQQPARKA